MKRSWAGKNMGKVCAQNINTTNPHITTIQAIEKELI